MSKLDYYSKDAVLARVAQNTEEENILIQKIIDSMYTTR